MNKQSLLHELRAMGISTRVRRALGSVDRTQFVEPEYNDQAYINYPLPIPAGQTISQPYTVAYMVQLLEITQGDTILEIGAGSGYNAAVMAELAGPRGKIITLEIIPELARFAASNIARSGYRNISVIQANGYHGYPQCAPYDRIIVTAAAPRIPQPLIDQLRDGGIRVIPLGEMLYAQMYRIIKKGDSLQKTAHGEFSFVPFREIPGSA
jgi:protein-L-isoaspartate(D-aspartate) O-methyltransferase